MASNLRAMASNLIVMASNLLYKRYINGSLYVVAHKIVVKEARFCTCLVSLVAVIQLRLLLACPRYTLK